MISEETLIARLRGLPETERLQLLNKIELWFEQTVASKTSNIQRAVAAVERTWGTVRLAPDTVRWIAESKDLEYDLR